MNELFTSVLYFVVAQDLFEPFTINLKSNWVKKSMLNDIRWKDISNTAGELTDNISEENLGMWYWYRCTNTIYQRTHQRLSRV
jgi:hypothetical protein